MQCRRARAHSPVGVARRARFLSVLFPCFNVFTVTPSRDRDDAMVPREKRVVNQFWNGIR